MRKPTTGRVPVSIESVDEFLLGDSHSSRALDELLRISESTSEGRGGFGLKPEDVPLGSQRSFKRRRGERRGGSFFSRKKTRAAAYEDEGADADTSAQDKKSEIVIFSADEMETELESLKTFLDNGDNLAEISAGHFPRLWEEQVGRSEKDNSGEKKVALAKYLQLRQSREEQKDDSGVDSADDSVVQDDERPPTYADSQRDFQKALAFARQYEKARQESREEVVDVLEERANQVSHDLSQLEAGRRVVEGYAEELEGEVARLEEEKNSAASAAREAQRVVEVLKGDLESKAGVIAELQAENGDLRASQGRLGALQRELEAAGGKVAENEELRVRVAELAAEVEAKQAEIAELEAGARDWAEINEASQRVVKENEGLSANLEKAAVRIAALEAESVNIQDVRDELGAAELARDAAESARDKTKELLEAKNAELEAALAAKKLLEEENARLATRENELGLANEALQASLSKSEKREDVAVIKEQLAAALASAEAAKREAEKLGAVQAEELAQNTEELAAANLANQGLDEANRGLVAENEAFRVDIDELRAENGGLRAREGALNARLSELEGQVTRLAEAGAEQEEELAAKEAKIAELSREVGERVAAAEAAEGRAMMERARASELEAAAKSNNERFLAENQLAVEELVKLEALRNTERLAKEAALAAAEEANARAGSVEEARAKSEAEREAANARAVEQEEARRLLEQQNAELAAMQRSLGGRVAELEERLAEAGDKDSAVVTELRAELAAALAEAEALREGKRAAEEVALAAAEHAVRPELAASEALDAKTRAERARSDAERNAAAEKAAAEFDRSQMEAEKAARIEAERQLEDLQKSSDAALAAARRGVAEKEEELEDLRERLREEMDSKTAAGLMGEGADPLNDSGVVNDLEDGGVADMEGDDNAEESPDLGLMLLEQGTLEAELARQKARVVELERVEEELEAEREKVAELEGEGLLRHLAEKQVVKLQKDLEYWKLNYRDLDILRKESQEHRRVAEEDAKAAWASANDAEREAEAAQSRAESALAQKNQMESQRGVAQRDAEEARRLLEEGNAELQARLVAAEAANRDLEAKAAEAQEGWTREQLEEFKRQFEALQAEAAEALTEKEAALARLKDAEKQAEELEDKNVALEEQGNENREEIQKLRAENRLLRESQDLVTSNNDYLQADLEKVWAENDRLKSERVAVDRKIAELQDRLAVLEGQEPEAAKDDGRNAELLAQIEELKGQLRDQEAIKANNEEYAVENSRLKQAMENALSDARAAFAERDEALDRLEASLGTIIELEKRIEALRRQLTPVDEPDGPVEEREEFTGDNLGDLDFGDNEPEDVRAKLEALTAKLTEERARAAEFQRQFEELKPARRHQYMEVKPDDAGLLRGQGTLVNPGYVEMEPAGVEMAVQTEQENRGVELSDSGVIGAVSVGGEPAAVERKVATATTSVGTSAGAEAEVVEASTSTGGDFVGPTGGAAELWKRVVDAKVAVEPSAREEVLVSGRLGELTKENERLRAALEEAKRAAGGPSYKHTHVHNYVAPDITVSDASGEITVDGAGHNDEELEAVRAELDSLREVVAEARAEAERQKVAAKHAQERLKQRFKPDLAGIAEVYEDGLEANGQVKTFAEIGVQTDRVAAEVGASVGTGVGAGDDARFDVESAERREVMARDAERAALAMAREAEERAAAAVLRADELQRELDAQEEVVRVTPARVLPGAGQIVDRVVEVPVEIEREVPRPYPVPVRDEVRELELQEENARLRRELEDARVRKAAVPSTSPRSVSSAGTQVGDLDSPPAVADAGTEAMAVEEEVADRSNRFTVTEAGDVASGEFDDERIDPPRPSERRVGPAARPKPRIGTEHKVPDPIYVGRGDDGSTVVDGGGDGTVSHPGPAYVAPQAREADKVVFVRDGRRVGPLQHEWGLAAEEDDRRPINRPMRPAFGAVNYGDRSARTAVASQAVIDQIDAVRRAAEEARRREERNRRNGFRTWDRGAAPAAAEAREEDKAPTATFPTRGDRRGFVADSTKVTQDNPALTPASRRRSLRSTVGDATTSASGAKDRPAVGRLNMDDYSFLNSVLEDRDRGFSTRPLRADDVDRSVDSATSSGLRYPGVDVDEFLATVTKDAAVSTAGSTRREPPTIAPRKKVVGGRETTVPTAVSSLDSHAYHLVDVSDDGLNPVSLVAAYKRDATIAATSHDGDRSAVATTFTPVAPDVLKSASVTSASSSREEKPDLHSGRSASSTKEEISLKEAIKRTAESLFKRDIDNYNDSSGIDDGLRNKLTIGQENTVINSILSIISGEEDKKEAALNSSGNCRAIMAFARVLGDKSVAKSDKQEDLRASAIAAKDFAIKRLKEYKTIPKVENLSAELVKLKREPGTLITRPQIKSLSQIVDFSRN